jgi:hypothetical protein
MFQFKFTGIFFLRLIISLPGGHTVVQFIEALHYKLEGRGFDFQ